MLTDPEEIRIMAAARQKNLRDPNRPRGHFDNILSDFFGRVDFAGSRILDLGPGQFDFAVLARDRGAAVVSIDKDPAVIELGRYKGFDVVDGDIRQIDRATFGDKEFDGIFCKFSLNCFWIGPSASDQVGFVDRISRVLKPAAWGWIAPWNGPPKAPPLAHAMVKETLANQGAAFRRYGFLGFELSPHEARRYGVTGAVANNALFVRGLTPARSMRPLNQP